MHILAIDPGTTQSGWIEIREDGISDMGLERNDLVLATIPHIAKRADAVVIEKLESQGQVVGASTFETTWWSGRFFEAAKSKNENVHRITRRKVKLSLTGLASSKDVNVNQAIRDIMGEKGTKKNPGPLYGVRKDIWAALAVGLAWILDAEGDVARDRFIEQRLRWEKANERETFVARGCAAR